VTRIHIMGPPGSGKTVLGQRLASGLRIPFYELDSIAWEGGYPGIERSLNDRLGDVKRIAAQPSWVTEGIFLIWTDELLDAADQIIWLDIPLRVTFWRIVARRFKRSIARQNPPTGLRQQFRFIAQVFAYYVGKQRTDTRAFTKHHLQSYAQRLTRCRRVSDVETCYNAVLAQAKATIIYSLPEPDKG
jgi:adenylate kinase family enzyme